MISISRNLSVDQKQMIEVDDNDGCGVTAKHSLYNKKLPFPFKLHAMLEEVAQQPGNEDIISWQAHGRAFRVHNPRKFQDTIMPRYFNQTKYKSFQRQLHIYDFHRLSTGVDKGAYFHKAFIREQPSLSLQMDRQKIKGINAVSKVQENRKRDNAFYEYVGKLSKKVEEVPYQESNQSMYTPLYLNPASLLNSISFLPSHGCLSTDPRLFSISQKLFPNSQFPFLEPEKAFSDDHVPFLSSLRGCNLQSSNVRIGTKHTDNINVEKVDLKPLEHGEEVSFEGRRFFFVDN